MFLKKLLILCLFSPAVFAATQAEQNYANRIFQEVNLYRSRQGLSILTRHRGLDALAQGHCDRLVQKAGTFKISGSNVSHEGFSGRAAVANQNFKMSNVAENVAFSFTQNASPQQFVNLWNQSKIHRFVMVGKTWTNSGIAVRITKEGVVATQLFGVVNNTQALGGPMSRGFGGMR